MSFQIEEQFEVETDPERVWKYLLDPDRVVTCLPGATLLESVDDRTFKGRVKVSVGPVTVAYEGTAHFAEIDEGARTVKIEAQGDEASGPGSARMTMTSSVKSTEGGSTQVLVHADVEVAGKIVQFGRGMIQTVSGQLFSQFSECARSRLEEAGADAGQPGDGAQPSAGGGEDEGDWTPDTDEDASIPLFSTLWAALKEMLAGLLRRSRSD